MPGTTQVNPERLRRFFHPQRIALIGATDKSGWSQQVFANLLAFSGHVPYCVNPRAGRAHGQPAYRALAALPETVDLAFVMVPPAHVVSVALEAAAVGIRHLVVLTSGFGEIGPEGAVLEDQLLAVAREHDLMILGPNGNGFINYTARITPYGLPIAPPLLAGPVGVVLQSGALASAVLTFSQAHAIGLSLLVSMGNETMISTTDVLDYLLEDEETRVIALFLESIRRPDELRRLAAKAVERGKPIIAFKVGRSALGSQTALAHTGALVGNHEVNTAALRQLGIILVDSMEDLLISAGLLGYTSKLAGRRFGVVTPSGGACDVLSDRAEDEGILFPPFAPKLLNA